MREKGCGQETAAIFFLQQVSDHTFFCLAWFSFCFVAGFVFLFVCLFVCLFRFVLSCFGFGLVWFPFLLLLFFSLFEFSLDHKVRAHAKFEYSP